MQYYSCGIKKVLDELKSTEKGLSKDQLSGRKSASQNKLVSEKKPSLIAKFFAQFKDLMVIILIVSAAISITLAFVSKQYENLFEGGIIVFIVILNASLGVVQENKAENALDNLKKTYRAFLRCFARWQIRKYKS